MSTVVLVGHSRGGEGVERAAIDSRPDDPWRIQGLVLIGPTAFGRQVAAGVHTTVLLPFCDGDVSDLQGQQYVDIGRDLTRDPALRSSVMAMGTNHNFYNTEWTPASRSLPPGTTGSIPVIAVRRDA
jgi:pimeloyl-ACP methyl ester carboxylesterase